VDTTENWPLLRALCQETEKAERHEEAIVDGLRTNAERGAQRSSLARRQVVDQIETGPHKLMHPREREFVLRLDADAAKHPHPFRAALGVLEQRRLADPRIPTHDQNRASLCSSSIEQTADHLQLPVAPYRGPHRQILDLAWDTRLGNCPSRAPAHGPRVAAML